MGQLVGSLAQPGSALVDSSGNAALVGKPSQMIDQIGSSANFKPFAQGGTQPAQSPLHNLGIGTPSFSQAASAGATPGGANATSPGLTKGGKLATLLMSGLQGALAGRAKSEETTAATGGRRSGGAGMGFEAGYTLPWQRAAQQNQLAQQQAQTGVLQSEAQNFNLPGMGQVPGWLAKTLGPAYLRSQATENAADTRAGASRDVANIGAGARVQAAQIGQRYKAVPGVGLFDTQTRQLVPQTEQGITITPEVAKDYQLPPDFIGKPMSLSNLASVQRSSVFENVPQMTDQGPIIVNRRNAQATPVTGPGGRRFGPPALATPIPVVTDPNNPGNVTFLPRGQATGLQAPTGAPTAAAKTEAKSEVPTKIGDLTVAYDTMIQHAQLLRKAAKNLNNGDVQALARLKNDFKNAFGYEGPITAQAIADAYKGEVSNVINKGHITDTGNEKIAHTLDPTAQNFKTVDSVLSAYESLAQSKKDMMNKQAAKAKNPNAGSSGLTAADMLKKYPPKK